MKKVLNIEYDDKSGKMDCNCYASVEDMVLMMAFTFRQQIINCAKQTAKERGEILTDETLAIVLHHAAYDYGKEFSEIIEFGRIKANET